MSRRTSREIAFQLLYAKEVSGENNPDLVITRYKHLNRSKDQEVINYGENLYKWSLELLKTIDVELESVIVNWSYNRVSSIDKSILRLACAEIKKTETPYNIVINEA